MTTNHYTTLGISRTATADDIQGAYRALARRFHPDRNSAADAASRMVAINKAYEVLGDPKRRREYDRKLAGAARPSALSAIVLQAARDVKFFEQDDIYKNMLKLNPAYKLITLPKGTYPKQDKDLTVIGFHTHVVASCKLPEQMVYTMTKTIADNTKTLGTVARDILKLTPIGMASDIDVKFHPGAAKFYKEAGISVKTN